MAQRKPCSCLCSTRVNTAKIDPEDGRLVWAKRITFFDPDYLPEYPGNYDGKAIRPIHDGTDDLALVLFQHQTSKSRVVRISNRGKKVWQCDDVSPKWQNHKFLDTAPDGAIYVYGNEIGPPFPDDGVFRLDSDGEIEWSRGPGFGGGGLNSLIARQNSNVVYSYLSTNGYATDTYEWDTEGTVNGGTMWAGNYWRFYEWTTDDIWAQGGNYLQGYALMAKNGGYQSVGESNLVTDQGVSDASGLFCIAGVFSSGQGLRHYTTIDDWTTLRVLTETSSGLAITNGMTKNTDSLFMSGYMSFLDEEYDPKQVAATDLDGETLWKVDINNLAGMGYFACCMGDDGYLYVTGTEADKVED